LTTPELAAVRLSDSLAEQGRNASAVISYHVDMPSTQVDVADECETEAPEEEAEGLRFDDPYWDDAFCAWWDPALRTCCS
ncbi:MAG TPA: hypothetical protein VGW79_04185, partial [Actinomycetota bacterium]|nr:hypothetical protein [Actinomycetota bacterium]